MSLKFVRILACGQDVGDVTMSNVSNWILALEVQQ